MDRTKGCGAISAEDALSYGFTGPNLRAAGVDYDVRVFTPYSSYEDFEFEIPIGETGDSYDRYLVRQEEVWQSLKLIKDALANLPEGSFHADVPEYYLPEKELVYEVKTKSTAGDGLQKSLAAQDARFRTFIKHNKKDNVYTIRVLVVKENKEQLLGWRVYVSR